MIKPCSLSYQDGYGGESDSGISDTDQSLPSPPPPFLQVDSDKEEESSEEAAARGSGADLFGDLHSILTPPPEEDGEDWAAMRSTITAGFYTAMDDSSAAAVAAAAVDLFSDSESVLFEEEDPLGGVFGPEIPPELAEAGIPEIEDHGAIQAGGKMCVCSWQCFGSASGWIRIKIAAWIRIRIRYADPDPANEN